MIPTRAKCITVGVLAEDRTDCDAFSVLLKRIALDEGFANLGVKTQKTDGCGPIKSKGHRIVKNLLRSCESVVIVHDLDRNDEHELRATLLAKLEDLHPHCLLCIPAEELEAWFWCDQAVLDLVTRAPAVKKATSQPHKLQSPKELLQKASRDAGGRPLYSTNDNAELMKHLDIAKCAAVCPAMNEVVDFVRQRLEPLKANAKGKA